MESPGSGPILDVAQAMGEDLDGVAHQLSGVIHAQIAELDDDLLLGTHESCRSNLDTIMTMLTDGTRPSMASPPPEALAYAKEYVRRGLGFEVLQRAYRIGQATLSRMWLQELQMRTVDAVQLGDTFGFFNDWLFIWVETLENRLTEYYMAERERQLRGTSAMRVEQVRVILEGAVVDARSASARLKYELDRRHLAYLVWPDEATIDAPNGNLLFAAMEHVAADVADLLGASDHISIPLSGFLACWAGFRETPRTMTKTATSVLDHLSQRAIYVALGEPGEGVSGFKRSHEEALLTRRVQRLRSKETRTVCVQFSDVALEAMLTHSREEARRFVRHELGKLADADESALRLRATLAVFLEEQASFVAAAERLGVHKNTVAYRIRRAQDLLGRDVRERQLELQTALRIADLGL
ncbi:MAG TPA: helix-turn-helix domain-containing protein [Solirubrobacteraceae bacterium]|nr:helix-turn-helix domain-containing protein [Solirubrobacteraceae bacterium]